MSNYLFRCAECGSVTPVDFPFPPPAAAVLSKACEEPDCYGDLTPVHGTLPEEDCGA